MRKLFDFIKLSFWNGKLAHITLIFSIEVIVQSLFCYFENDWTFSNMGHVIFWSISLIIIITIRICLKIYKK